MDDLRRLLLVEDSPFYFSLPKQIEEGNNGRAKTHPVG